MFPPGSCFETSIFIYVFKNLSLACCEVVLQVFEMVFDRWRAQFCCLSALFFQMLGNPDSKPSFFSDKALEPVIKSIVRKFPTVSSSVSKVILTLLETLQSEVLNLMNFQYLPVKPRMRTPSCCIEILFWICHRRVFCILSFCFKIIWILKLIYQWLFR